MSNELKVLLAILIVLMLSYAFIVYIAVKVREFCDIADKSIPKKPNCIELNDQSATKWGKCPDCGELVADSQCRCKCGRELEWE